MQERRFVVSYLAFFERLDKVARLLERIRISLFLLSLRVLLKKHRNAVRQPSYLLWRPLGFAPPPHDGFALLAAAPLGKRCVCLLRVMTVNNEDVKDCLYSLTFRELEFSETPIQLCESLCVRTGAKRHFAPL
jgi:hypothetical protein